MKRFEPYITTLENLFEDSTAHKLPDEFDSKIEMALDGQPSRYL